MGKLNHNIRVQYGSTPRAERQLGTLDIVNHQPYPVEYSFLPAVAHTPLRKGAQYVWYTRPINSKSCPPSYVIKEACLDDTRSPRLGSPLSLSLNRLCLHCSRPSSIP